MKKENKSLDEGVEDEIQNPNIVVRFESFEEIHKKNEQQKEEFAKWNSGINLSEWESERLNLKEEMNLNGNSNFMYVGKGSLF